MLRGTRFPLKAGETVIFPAGAPHALAAIPEFRMSLVMIQEKKREIGRRWVFFLRWVNGAEVTV